MTCHVQDGAQVAVKEVWPSGVGWRRATLLVGTGDSYPTARSVDADK